MKKKLVAIVGPTAVGKTDLSIEVAKRFNGEIISGDAMQVYKGMDIGTAKATIEEREGIPHHMLDIKQPDEPFSVADFQSHVYACIEDIIARNKLPILVGGSGLYVQAVIHHYQFAEHKRNEAFTQKLETFAEANGVEALYEKLVVIDPEHARTIHPNNYRRVIRALDIYESTGLTMTEYQQAQVNNQPYDAYLIGLEMDRASLYDRINQRVDKMVATGLIQEVEYLYNMGYEHEQAMKAIGYKELIPYLKGEIGLTEAIEHLKQNSRRFAKRQYTWFKNKMDVTWYAVSEQNKSRVWKTIFTDLEGFLKDM
ncbi:tRNA (adenosine(37)-N6)-dimethylallyltransferase MiaA [Lentibacillus saliphilus]|uniref:tRNA (adenosine(37)-N6)-dimethylallyltransferase MiaA n=1 Tax=Lentibacillus saliphilus TaxID=2737028 RepID=UPI001C30EB18|nr:tRNA (adenosine(37)-N6)-dimethylallyltransferase MiaA [Lentibacillus saliphilus]